MAKKITTPINTSNPAVPVDPSELIDNEALKNPLGIGKEGQDNHLDTGFAGVGRFYTGEDIIWPAPPIPKDAKIIDENSIDKPEGREGAVPSIFNRYSIFFFNNTSDVGKSKDSENYIDGVNRIKDKALMDVRLNPTAKKIINWSQSGETNSVEYAIEDFLWCKNYGQVPNNYLITLRRFPTPVEDDIFDNKKVPNPDIGRMLSWVDGVSNKWEQVGLSWSHGMEWGEVTADIQPVNASEAGYGTTEVGGLEKAVGLLRGDFSKGFLSNPNAVGQDVGYENKNVTYGPIDVINKTNIRNRGLKFDQKITLTFEYKLKSIDQVNPKIAFIDLLSNILIVTANRGPFWGGDVRYYGANPRRFKPIGNPALLEKGDWAGYLGSMVTNLSATMSALSGNSTGFSWDTLWKDIKNVGAGIAQNLGNQLAGAQLDKMGRPGIMAINSLLTGERTGEWHLTVGNPANPIMSIGNLMLKETKIEFGGALGVDDFPSELKVICDLEPAMPRDRIDIISMFHRNNRTYVTTSPITRQYAGNSRGPKNGGRIPAPQSKKQADTALQNWKSEFKAALDSKNPGSLKFNNYVDERFPNHTSASGAGAVHTSAKQIG